MFESPSAQATSLANELFRHISQAHPGIIEYFLPDRYIAEMDADTSYGGYSRVPEAVRNACQRIEERAGAETLEQYHRLVMLTLMANFDERHPNLKLPASVMAQYQLEFRRILAQFSRNKTGFYLHGNDLFSKDLAICRCKLLPCGAELVDVRSGIPRSLALKDGPGQFVDILTYGLRLGGFRPLFEMHLDPRSLTQFTPDGWDRCYLRIADLLEARPEALGVFGSSWWFDPAVEKITPNLGYLRQRPIGAGARIFYIGSDQAAVGNATKFSKLRKDLYEQGKYIPTNYLMVWARRDLLAWARNARANGLET